ncbi:hypothetical protein [Micromonospora arida]|uniref:hypothetical protein n=1 Tax=Micromonospora arida TaxID=2203715 RepID=UPI0033CBA8BC
MKASWLAERFLNSSTPQPEAFTYLRHQTVSSHNLNQPPWTAHLDPEAVITRAENVWEALRLQDEAQPGEVRGTKDAQWDLPDGCDEALGDVLGVWIQMWPAGLDTERKALQRRIENVGRQLTIDRRPMRARFGGAGWEQQGALNGLELRPTVSDHAQQHHP